MTAVVNVHEAKTHLSKLLQRVESGEEIIIARAGEPVAVLTAVVKPVGRRTPGNDAGKVVITPAFDEPLTEFEA